MTVSPGNIGTIAYSAESALGTQTGSWYDIRPQGWPEHPTKTRLLAANSNAGHRNPMSAEKGEPYEIYRENAIKFSTPIRRAETDGDQPDIMYFLESGGWTVNVGGATTTAAAGSQSTTNIELTSATGMAEGEAILAERDPGIYVPILIGSLSGVNVTPSIAMSSACGDSETVEIMYTATPTTSYTNVYNVPANKTLEFKINTMGKHDDAFGDLTWIYTGCALAEIGQLEIGGVGSVPTLSFGFHAGDVAKTNDDIDADSFNDSVRLPVITSDFEFAFATEASGAPIGTLVTKDIISCTVDFGLKTIPIRAIGTGGLNGISGYMLIQAPPKVTLKTYCSGDSAFDKDFWVQLEATNASKYIHMIQPTRDLDQPAFGVWMPNCHIATGGEPEFSGSGELQTCTITFEGDLSDLDSGGTDIDDVSASPIYFAISSEAA